MQSREKLSKRTVWMIALDCALGLCVLALVSAINVHIKARGLYSSDWDARWRAACALHDMGLPGRMALLRAVRSEDEEIAEDAESDLHYALEKDVEAYWPQPIELPEFTVKVKVKEKSKSDE